MKATLSIMVGAIQAEHYREVHLIALGHQRSWTSGLRTEQPGLLGLRQVDGGQLATRLTWISVCLCPHPWLCSRSSCRGGALTLSLSSVPITLGPVCAQHTG